MDYDRLRGMKAVATVFGWCRCRASAAGMLNFGSGVVLERTRTERAYVLDMRYYLFFSNGS
ncbi:uncharacterized protein P174DRAFT_444850 [Aspergillus novofumigatus IBT 16806]|uniref:Uncharacterized protein n=1 Tax=Aspergillus novofumigatus (strain IBT 16806) TaxID=1392255 RepID=A0A2I1C0A8_ASPN1|nr:uncharacterized protein P174DRAFT_444850 [Aspergillus novofumigatus IBT 16806]PKX91070.1 hypothetical protein P174DRAFT_444850 [Aspergillus novofumigatus IBT 16806]